MPRSLHRFPWLRNLAAVIRDPQTLAKLHALLITTGAFNSGDCNGPLIAAYSRIKDLHFARHLFDKSPTRNISAWNALIIAYSRNNSPDDVLRLFRDLVLQEQPRPDSSTFTIAIKACAQLRDLRTGEMILSLAVLSGYSADVFVSSSLLNLYAKCREMDRALEVFDRMPRRDLVSWTTMITGFSSSGRPVDAIEIYQRMKSKNFEGDEVSMVALVQACASLGDMKLGSSIHGYLMRNYPILDIVTETALVDMYAKNGLPLHACNLLDRMPRRNLVSWSALISGLSQNGLAEEALRVLIRMQEEEKLEPDPVALVSSLLSCSQIGLLRQGKTIHGFILRRHDLDKISATAIIDMYCKCGNLTAGRFLFDRTSCRDSISWNAMISSYGVHGRGREALDLFLQMTNANLIPDHATFSSLLAALSHCGMVEEGKLWFSLMRSDFGIEPSDKHFACMVDLLARSGFLQEAYELANSMPGDPGIPILVALLSGCRLHRGNELGEEIADKILTLGCEDLGVYTLISNFFAAAKNWDRVAEIRSAMRKIPAKKVPGYSFVEIAGRIHGFLVEDETHPQFQEISRILEKLGMEMEKLGYRAKTEFVLQDLDEEEKRKKLCSHSERIAIAFALLNSSPGERIVVIKNLRVCGDCHVAIKFISRIVDREIVVRDSRRFHHFKGGVCSCGDFW